MQYTSADSGFGHLPDFAQWTATRYACPRHERRESEKMFSQPWVAFRFKKQVIVFLFNVCYNNTRIRIQ